MKKEIRKVLLKFFVLLLPFFIIAGSFIFIDPFGVVHNKEILSATSEDFLSTELYIKNTKGINYNAFIFGNSKTLAFRSIDWKKYVNDSMEVFKFGSPGESINNIYKKLQLIRSYDDKLKHVLVLLDDGVFRNVNNTGKAFSGPVYKHHWKTTDDNVLDFYFTYFKYYLKDFNFIKYIDYSVFNVHRSYMKDVINATSKKLNTKENEVFINSRTNEFYFKGIEDQIKRVGFGAYFKEHTDLFSISSIDKPISDVLIHPIDIEYLKQIRSIFDEEHTSYKIIFGVAFNHQIINPFNVKSVVDIFGKENVFDFSGKNEISSDSSFFYENQHYRPIAGDLMLKMVYSGK